MEIFREDRVVFEHFEMREFSGSHRGDALYQGPDFSRAAEAQKDLGF